MYIPVIVVLLYFCAPVATWWLSTSSGVSQSTPVYVLPWWVWLACALLCLFIISLLTIVGLALYCLLKNAEGKKALRRKQSAKEDRVSEKEDEEEPYTFHLKGRCGLLPFTRHT